MRIKVTDLRDQGATERQLEEFKPAPWQQMGPISPEKSHCTTCNEDIGYRGDDHAEAFQPHIDAFNDYVAKKGHTNTPAYRQLRENALDSQTIISQGGWSHTNTREAPSLNQSHKITPSHSPEQEGTRYLGRYMAPIPAEDAPKLSRQFKN